MAESMVIVVGIPEVAHALEKYPEIANALFANATETSLYSMVNDLADYPSRDTDYRRTGTLGREWGIATPAFESMRSGFEGSLTNNTPYAGYVQGDSEGHGQAGAHRGYWILANDLLASARTRIEGYYRSAVGEIESRINGILR
jgi:hypothetical protein